MSFRLLVAAALTVVCAGPVLAQNAAVASATSAAGALDLRLGRTIFTADGKRVGPIDRIGRDQAGAAVSANVIYNGKMVAIPVATLTPADPNLTTSRKLVDVRKMH